MLVVLAPLPLCVAVTFEAIYDDKDGEGFKDETALAQVEKEFLSARGNDAETLGDARKKAFEHATSILESRLTNTNTIRISAKFVFFSGQEDPPNSGLCSISGDFLVGYGGAEEFFYPGNRLDEGDTNNPGLGTAYPIALGEALSGRELSKQEQDADIFIWISKCAPFYYGFTGSVPRNQIDFVSLSLHEVMHGLGFLTQVQETRRFSREDDYG